MNESLTKSLIQTMLNSNKERQFDDESHNDNQDVDESDEGDDSDSNNDSDYSDGSDDNDDLDPAVPNEIYEKEYKIVYLPYQSRIIQENFEEKIHKNYKDFKSFCKVNIEL